MDDDIKPNLNLTENKETQDTSSSATNSANPQDQTIDLNSETPPNSTKTLDPSIPNQTQNNLTETENIKIKTEDDPPSPSLKQENKLQMDVDPPLDLKDSPETKNIESPSQNGNDSDRNSEIAVDDNLFGSESESEKDKGDYQHKKIKPEFSDEMSGSDQIEETVDTEQLRIMEAALTKQSENLSNQENIIVAKLPTGLCIDPHVFDQDNWEDFFEKEREIFLKNNKKIGSNPNTIMAEWLRHAQTLIENTVRWSVMTDPNTKEKHEVSNSHLIKWNDGSITLHIGNGEPFIVEGSSLVSNTKPVAKSEGMSGRSNFKESKQYLALHHTQEGLLQTRSRITESWIVRPAQISQVQALTASARAIRNTSGPFITKNGDISKVSGEIINTLPGISDMSTNAGQNMARKFPAFGGAGSSGTKFFVPDKDPELVAREQEKAEEARERAQRRIESTRRRQEDRMLAGLSSGKGDAEMYSEDEFSDEQTVQYEEKSMSTFGSERQTSARKNENTGRSPSYSKKKAFSSRGSNRSIPSGNRGANSSYYDEELDDDFIVDDDEALEVGSFDEFDDEELEEDERYKKKSGNRGSHTHKSAHLSSSPSSDHEHESSKKRSYDEELPSGGIKKTSRKQESSHRNVKKRTLIASDDSGSE
ncbi:hypothetical protein BB559_002252 [Furculomyces boomerangus]|uniref:Leo1-like protein n=1 Tax=Furculomyces boomerangus TaxID=61424 RepID=A0A2T9YWU9_9FUNG|nr:hypothetical protein BB559_002252 [Furculomyces boomerangus]